MEESEGDSVVWALGRAQTIPGLGSDISWLPPGRGRSGEERGTDWQSDDGWWSDDGLGMAVFWGQAVPTPGAGGRRSLTEVGETQAVAGEFVNEFNGFEVGLASGEGVDEAGGFGIVGAQAIGA